MIIGMVIGTVVSTHKAPELERGKYLDGSEAHPPTPAGKGGELAGAKYLLIEKCDQHGKGKKQYQVALDQVGAGTGELIFMSQGSPNRNTDRTDDKPIDASVLGIIDVIEECGKTVYDKSKGHG